MRWLTVSAKGMPAGVRQEGEAAGAYCLPWVRLLKVWALWASTSSCACTPRAHQLWPSLESACRCEREASIAGADSDGGRLKAQRRLMPSLVDAGVRFALTAKLLMSRSCYMLSAKGTGG